MSQTMDAGEDAPQMFAVQPKMNCPHIAAGLSQGSITVDSMLSTTLLAHYKSFSILIHNFVFFTNQPVSFMTSASFNLNQYFQAYSD